MNGKVIAGAATAATPILVSLPPVWIAGLVLAGGAVAVGTILAMRAKGVSYQDGQGNSVTVEC